MYGELEHNTQLFEHYFRHYVGIAPEECPDRIVVTPAGFEDLGGGDFQSMVGNMGWQVTPIMNIPGARFGRSFLIKKAGARILWSVGGIGAPYAFGHATLLSLTRSVRAVLFYGAAGGIGEEVKSYDINIPVSAICGAQVKEGWEPDVKELTTDPRLSSLFASRLRPELAQWNRNVHLGHHYTTGHYFMETLSLLTHLKSVGILTIDLEFAVYASILRKAGVAVAGILRASDLPLNDIAFHDSLEKKGVSKEQAAGVKHGILTVVLSILQQDISE